MAGRRVAPALNFKTKVVRTRSFHSHFTVSLGIVCLKIILAAATSPLTHEYMKSLPEVNFDLADASETDVLYKLFRSYEDYEDKEGKVVTIHNVKQEALEKDRPLVLIMHGWTTDDTSPWYEPLKHNYLTTGDYNILYINWKKAGNKIYNISCANVKPVGKYIAEFLIATDVPAKFIHIIGHSLGSHLSSFIGKYYLALKGEKIGRITALDPAGPKFEHPKMGPNLRLCEEDAAFVDVIHTDSHYFGYSATIGHVDYYPNGGKVQPGCPPREEDDNCCHARSTLFFIESVRVKTKAKEANYTVVDGEIKITPKDGSKEIVFGQHVDLKARGVYYFETNAARPYLK